MSIFSTKHQTRATELMKYMSIIRDAAVKFPGTGWAEYDTHFRMRQAAQPERDWATIDGELWYTVLIPAAVQGRSGGGAGGWESSSTRSGSWTNRPTQLSTSLGRNTCSENARAGGGVGAGTAGACFAFNKGGCNKTFCRFAHACIRCGSKLHSVTSGLCRGGTQHK